MKTSGLIHIYCGDGKGKTTAAVGLDRWRCAGHGGNKVVFAQFLKDGTSGECRVLAKLLDVTIMAANPAGKFTFRMTDAEKRGDSGRAHPHLRCGNRLCCADARDGCSC
ncbi:MAG: cob(I)yrinic acid a,c-diamide adenosyltransferase [Butyricicoccaceae bacterium]